MTIFFNNLKRIFRKKMNIVVMFIIPIAFTAIIASMSSSGNTGFSIGFVNNDNAKLTSMLKETLKSKGTILEIKQDKIKDDIINKSIDTAIVIPKGFTESVLKNKNSDKIQMYGIKGMTNDSSIKYLVDSFTNAAKNISLASKGDSNKFYQGIKDYEKGNFDSQVKYTNGESEKLEVSSSSLGFLVMSMIYLSAMVTTLILKDKDSGTYNRIFASGIKSGNYMFQCVLSFIVIYLIQIAGVLLVMKNVFHSDLGPSLINLFVVFAVFGIACVALGVAICNRSKTLKQANATVALVSTPIAMLGGCFWPRDVMGSTLQNISNFVPSTWAMKASDKILNGSSLMNVSQELGIIMIFAVAFFIIGSVKRVKS